MSTLDWSLQQATKTTAEIAAATTKIPKAGQIVWNTDTGKYCIGDGTTALSALTFYGGISASGLTVGTTTITGGTNTKVLYNNNGVVGEYTVTGTGSAVLNTSPTFVTDITTPSIVLSGAISAASWTTSGVNIKETARVLTNTTSSGTVTNTYTNVYGGNSIVSSSATTYTNYYANYFKSEVASTGSTITNNYALGTNGAVNLTLGTASIILANLATTTTNSALYMNVTPSTSNYTIRSNGSNTWLSTGGSSLLLQTSATTKFTIDSYKTTWSPSAYSGAGVGNLFELNPASGSTLTTGQEISTLVIGSSSKQYNTGAMTNHRDNWIKTTTIAYTGASTLTNYYGLYVEAATAGTNATITNNYSLGTNGKAKFGGNIELTQTVTTEALVSDTSVTIVINGVTYKLLAKA